MLVSKLDEKKAKLDELRVYRNFALTSLLTLIGFIFTKISEINVWLLSICAFAVLMLGICVIVLQNKISKIIKDIGEL